jgi:hypothetical protein
MQNRQSLEYQPTYHFTNERVEEGIGLSSQQNGRQHLSLIVALFITSMWAFLLVATSNYKTETILQGFSDYLPFIMCNIERKDLMTKTMRYLHGRPPLFEQCSYWTKFEHPISLVIAAFALLVTFIAQKKQHPYRHLLWIITEHYCLFLGIRYVGVYLQGFSSCAPIVKQLSIEFLRDVELLETFRIRSQQYIDIITDNGSSNYRVVLLLLVGCLLVCLKRTVRPPWWIVVFLWSILMAWYTYQLEGGYLYVLAYDIPPFLAFFLMVAVMVLITQIMFEFVVPSLVKLFIVLLSCLTFLRLQLFIPDPCFVVVGSFIANFVTLFAHSYVFNVNVLRLIGALMIWFGLLAYLPKLQIEWLVVICGAGSLVEHIFLNRDLRDDELSNQ